MPHVCLFDIDGTLMNTGGAGQHAMEQALLEVFGVAGPYEDILAAGRTDRAITADLFAHHGIDPTEENLQTFLRAYVRHLPRSLNSQEGRILPGVGALLDELTALETVALGLLTGNYQVGAQLKLQHYSIDHHFAFGGFGDVHESRDDVARIALRSAEEHLERSIETRTVWVVGDTPADIQCGRAINANVVAVATGIFSAQELQAAGPDLLFENFSDIKLFLDTVIG